jgi:transaldolase
MLLIDSADTEQLARALAHPAVGGVTTNPTLIARAAGTEALSASDYLRRTHHLCRWASGLRLPSRTAPRALMLQGVGAPDDIMAQGTIWREALADVPWKLWVKLLPTEAALRAIAPLRARGISTLVTAVYTPAQAYVACEAGADGVALYLGRMQRQLPDWHDTVRSIVDTVHGFDRMMLLASFPDLTTLQGGLTYSSNVTIPPPLLTQLLASTASREAIEAFEARILKPG